MCFSFKSAYKNTHCSVIADMEALLYPQSSFLQTFNMTVQYYYMVSPLYWVLGTWKIWQQGSCQSKFWPAFLDLSDMFLSAQIPKLDVDEDIPRASKLAHLVITPGTKPDYLSWSFEVT